MSGRFSLLLYHCVFGTQDRRGVIHAAVAGELYPYMASILPPAKGKVLKVGGAKDHVHVLLELTTDTTVAEAMRLIKSNSSRWLNASGLCGGPFRWQRGFAAFTVSQSAKDDVASYIGRQQIHHRRGGWDEELAALLARHGLSCGGAGG